MNETETEMMIILKFGSIANAYKLLVTAWTTTPSMRLPNLTPTEYALVMKWETNMHEQSGLGINDPR